MHSARTTGYLVVVMRNRQSRIGFQARGRRVVVWLAVLLLCLNTLLPTVAMAMAVHGRQPAVICTPEGAKTIRLDQHGAPLPKPLAHEGHDCTLCYSLGDWAAPEPALKVAMGSNVQDAIRPKDMPPHASADVQGGEARGPPHYA